MDCVEVTPSCPISATTYGYTPELAPNALLLAIFAIVTCSSLVIGILTKTWTYAFALAAGSLLETVGYAGRLIMHNNPWDQQGFRMQITCLILGPSFIAASIYVTLKHLVIYCGAEHSRIPAKWWPRTFIGCDIGSILLQAAGGGIAGAAGSTDIDLLNVGNSMMIAGIAFQVATMSICGVLVVDYLIRRRSAVRKGHANSSQYSSEKDLPRQRTRFHVFCASIGLAYLTVLIRCVYRLPEMAGGWGNPLMQNEKEFLLLDGMMVAIACVALCCIHPGYFFTPMRFNQTDKQVELESLASNTPPSRG